MKKALQQFPAILIAVLLFSTAQASALESQSRGPKAAVLKSLAINRSMLARFEAEYAALSQEGKESSSGHVKKELTNLGYKIKALDEEKEKLTEALPETLQANEFLKDMLAKSEAATPATIPPSAIRPSEKVEEKRSTETNKLHERALEYVAKKDLKKAIKLYEEIILENPGDDEAYLIMGHCLVLTGSYEKAERAFQSAVQINPENVAQIMPFYENLVIQNPEDPDAFANLGFVCLMFGNANGADKAFSEALSLNPENPSALRGLRILQSQPS